MDVSIIVPVYNASQYLVTCLESLLHQNTQYTYEIICINDGSSDDSLTILKAYEDKIVLINQVNQGPGSARNNGIKQAKGKYLMFADSDDYVRDNFVECMLSSLLEANADICICDFYRDLGNEIEYVNKGEYKIYELGSFQQPLLMEYHSVNKIFKKEIFEMYPKHMFFEDVVAIALSLLNAKRIVKIEEALYYYRDVKESTTNTLSKKIYDIEVAIRMIEPKFIEKGYQDVIEFLYVNGVLVDLCIKIVRSKIKNGKQEVYKHFEMVNKKYPNWKKNVYLKHTRRMKRLYLFFLRHHLYGIIHVIYGMR